MTEHVRWIAGRQSGRGFGQILYVKGYILALEDVLKDAKEVLEWAEQTHSDPAALGRLVEVTVGSLKSARMTLEALTK